MSERLQEIAGLFKKLTYEEFLRFADFLSSSSINCLQDIVSNEHKYHEAIDSKYYADIISDWADEEINRDV